MKVRILSAREVRRALPMADAVDAMKRAFSQLAQGEADLPLRTQLEAPDHQTISLIMPGYLPRESAIAVKLVSIGSKNPARGLPSIHALVVVIEPSTGRPLAVLEGGSLTAIRTGAASGAATDLLARPEARTLLVIGSGVQAHTQLEAVCTVRSIEQVWVASRTYEHAEQFAAQIAGVDPVPARVEAVRDPPSVLPQAEIICMATPATAPLFDGRMLQAGTHVNAVGSFTPTMAEFDLVTLQRSRVIVDSIEAAMEEAGEIIQAVRQGSYSFDEIGAELGEIINGKKPGRQEPGEITLFKSVGLAVQDVAAAAQVLANAERDDLGTILDL